MVYTDPYGQDPLRASQALKRMVVLSVFLHGVAIVLFVLLGGARLLADSGKKPPPKVYRVELVAMAPMAEEPKLLPDKVTKQAQPEPLTPDTMKLPIKEDVAKVPEVKKPEPKPKATPKVEKKPKKEPKPDSIASLASMFKNRQVSDTKKPPPNAAPGPKNRPVEPQIKGPDTRGVGDAKVYAPDTPEGRFIAEVKARVINAWSFPPRLKREASGLLVLIEVQLTASGKMVNPSIFKESGNKTIDQSALRAVSMVAQRDTFPNPPDSLKGETFQFAFSPKEGK